MLITRQIMTDGISCTVTISDDSKALLSAYKEGGAVVGLWNRDQPNQDLSPSKYVVESLEDIDEEFLERVARRRLGLPWVIARTARLVIREFREEDWKELERWLDREKPEKGFADREAFLAYIKSQYGFFEFGIWAVTERRTGRLIGRAGLTQIEESWRKLEERGLDLEIGYHIFPPYRQKGYGTEAAKAITAYGEENLEANVWARIKKENKPSRRLAEELGFILIDPECNGLRLYLHQNDCCC